MSAQHFRTALGGFNREDVVRYIEFMNNQYQSQIAQLNNQLKEARERAADPGLEERLQKAASAVEALESQLVAEQQKCQELEAQLAAAKQSVTGHAEAELEAYRRAERAERLASERAQLVYDKANAVIADASCKVEEAAANIDAAAGQMQQYLQSYMSSVSEAKAILQEAQSGLQAIRPEEE